MTTDVMRVESRVLDDDDLQCIRDVKTQGNAMCLALEFLAKAYPQGSREFAICKTKAEELVMWATKGITA